MGHDISAYKKGDNKEIAYLRIGASNRTKANIFYASLDAQKYDGGVSGTANEIDFNLNNIKLAKSKLGYLKKEDPSYYKNREADKGSADMLAMVSEMLTGGAADLGIEQGDPDRYEIEDIEKFYDDIIATGVNEIIISFY
jgi:hypothetical protein